MEGVVLAILAVVGVLAVASACIFAFVRRKNRQLRSARLAVLAAALTFVVATAGFVALARTRYFDTLVHPPSTTGVHVVFTSQTYNTETFLFSLNASVRGLKPGRELWIVFRGAQRNHLFPAPGPCIILPENQLSCQQVLTSALNPQVAKVKGFLVAAVPKAAAMFRQYNSGLLGTTGLRELPDGATLVSQISVGG